MKERNTKKKKRYVGMSGTPFRHDWVVGRSKTFIPVSILLAGSLLLAAPYTFALKTFSLPYQYTRVALASVATLREVDDDLEDYILAIRDSCPGRSSENFVVPSTEEMHEFRAFVNSVMVCNFQQAVNLANKLGYEIIEFRDTSDYHKLYYIIKEKPPIVKGWGAYVFNLDQDARDISIEVPHPLFDYNTAEIGLTQFKKLNAQEFLIAGTHRYANADHLSDMAHTYLSMFQVVHEAATSSDTIVIQFHGFSEKKHPGFPQITLSNGTPHPTDSLYFLAELMTLDGITVGVYDGKNYSELAGRTNIQGKWTKDVDGHFIMIEQGFEVRIDPSKYQFIINAFIASCNVEEVVRQRKREWYGSSPLRTQD